MNENELREYLSLKILDFAEKGYKGAALSDDIRVLEVAEYIKYALKEAARIVRED